MRYVSQEDLLAGLPAVLSLVCCLLAWCCPTVPTSCWATGYDLGSGLDRASESTSVPKSLWVGKLKLPSPFFRQNSDWCQLLLYGRIRRTFLEPFSDAWCTLSFYTSAAFLMLSCSSLDTVSNNKKHQKIHKPFLFGQCPEGGTIPPSTETFDFKSHWTFPLNCYKSQRLVWWLPDWV